MQTTAAFDGLACTACGERFTAAAAPGRCPACGEILDPQYELAAIELDRATLASRRFADFWRYAEVLPYGRSQGVSLGGRGDAARRVPATGR